MNGEDRCNAFNAGNPVGSRVWVRRDSGELQPTTTRSLAWTLGDGTPVILLWGISGGFHLGRVFPESAFPCLDHPGSFTEGFRHEGVRP